MLFVNFKSAYEGTGERAIALVRELKEAQKETSVPIILVPHDLDVYQSLTLWEGEIWVQHTDYEYGDTGRNNVRLLADWSFDNKKIAGTLLNHSEHKYHSWDKLGLVVEECRKLGVKSMVFGGTQEEFSDACDLRPDFVAFEPPDLIASPTTSIAKVRPDQIQAAARVAEKAGVPLIVGAGVKDGDDVRVSLKLGALGVAVSSAVIRAEDPGKVVLELAEGFK